MTWSAMTWNVLFGGEERFDRIVEVIAAESPDVLVLQECLEWDAGDRLARAAGALGIAPDAQHVFLARARARPSGRRFHVAMLSRFPIRQAIAHADPAAVGHVIGEIAIDAPGGVAHVFGTHFDAHGEDERLRDARTLCRIVSAERLANERILVAGDLNALSPRDPYPSDLAARVRLAGTDKYGHPPRFETTALLEAHGFVDALHHGGTPPRWVTAERDRGGVRIDYRTDYLLVSPPLLAFVLGVEIHASGGASDHEPVVVTFR